MGALRKLFWRVIYDVHDEVGFFVNKLAGYCIVCNQRSTYACDAAWWYEAPHRQRKRAKEWRQNPPKVYRLKRDL